VEEMVKNSAFDLCPITVMFHSSSQTPQPEIENAMEGKENEDEITDKMWKWWNRASAALLQLKRYNKRRKRRRRR